RKKANHNHPLTHQSFHENELRQDPSLALDIVIAPPRMAKYIEYSTKIYDVYLKYVAAEDIHVYSIDEVFIDISSYLNTYHMTPYELTKTMIQDVLNTTGITATAGIGTNLYLCKVAMDIVAKHTQADQDGVRIAQLDEISYRKLLWDHTPITDFWRVGKGYAKRLAEEKIYTMRDVALCSIKNEDLLYDMFGVNAELLIDHAWGAEPTTIQDIKNYQPQTKSLGSGQVLHCPYTYEKAKLIVKEMSELLSLDLVEKQLVTDQVILTVGYDIESLTPSYKGEITIDHYGRKIPKHAHGTSHLTFPTSSTKQLMEVFTKLYEKIVDPHLLIRRINLTAAHLLNQNQVKEHDYHEQLDLFSCTNIDNQKIEEEKKELQEEQKLQKTILEIKKRYGKNSILKGMNLEEGATTIDRNEQIGGHKA
ncbi:MAG: DNA methylase, partial [Traorella sp.]